MGMADEVLHLTWHVVESRRVDHLYAVIGRIQDAFEDSVVAMSVMAARLGVVVEDPEDGPPSGPGMAAGS